MRDKIAEEIAGIDWGLLREQKEWLFQMSDTDARGEGLLALLDAIQDAAVDDGIATRDEVFGADPEEPLA